MIDVVLCAVGAEAEGDLLRGEFLGDPWLEVLGIVKGGAVGRGGLVGLLGLVGGARSGDELDVHLGVPTQGAGERPDASRTGFG